MFLHNEKEAKWAEKSTRKLWNDGFIVCFVTLKLRERRDEDLKHEIGVQKDGGLSCVCNSAVLRYG